MFTNSMPPPKQRQSLRPPPMRRSATPLAGMNHTRSALPAEIIATILDYLPVRDLMAFARVSRRLQEMVYDDTRWVTKLQLMGIWNESEARARFEEAMRKRRAAEAARRAEEERRFAEHRASAVAPRGATIFDVMEEAEKAKERRQTVTASAPSLRHGLGLDLLSLSDTPGPPPLLFDKNSLLSIFNSVRSIRGFARQEFARIYAALAPLYHDLVRARTHTDPVVFQMYSDPEEQARMLAQLRTFAESDTALGWAERTDRLKAMMGVFENAALREFEGGFDTGDIDGRMKRYAHVLILLNGGQACIQLFVQKHPVLYEQKEELGNPLDCFDVPTVGAFTLEPAKVFWDKLAVVLKEQADIIERVFPPTVNVIVPFMERVAEDVISEYITPLLDEAHDRSIEKYLIAVTGLLKQGLDFGASLAPVLSKSSAGNPMEEVMGVIKRVFDAHVDLYLQEELDFAKTKFNQEVDTWEQIVTEQETATESFFMSNINREAEKRDFLSTFKKVILAPVSAIPSAFNATRTPDPKPAAEPTSPPDPNNKRLSVASGGSGGSSEPDYFQSNTARNSTRLSVLGGSSGRASPSPSVLVAPTTELAAKAAIMNSKLQGISTLFSLDVALKLVHMAKESLERAAVFAKVGGQTGEEAREQCEAIFVALLQVLGPRHVKTGFDKAVDHLGKYNPRSVAEHMTSTGVAPLVTFLELVNVGDLIQQMIDVFYEQELVAAKLTDRNDFLNPATKEKKRFEQMLDERVAAGLNVGIDVLIDEVEHIFAITQQVTDFNPGALAGVVVGDQPTTPSPRGSHFQMDIAGPSSTAIKIVEIVESHTRLLNGSTDKNVLDVFNQEVGLRLFSAVCKHIKRQRISVDGAIRLISDVNLYYNYISTLKLRPLIPYFTALRELAQIYLIDPGHAKQMATVIADPARFGGIFRVEEVYEYATRREDWYRVKKDVERAMYGIGCCLM